MSGVAVITDGEQRSALAAVRSLGSKGWRVIVCAARPRSLAGASRFAKREVTVPDPLESPAAFAQAVVQVSKLEGANLVLPISEPAMLAVLPERSNLTPAVIPFPELDRFRGISDKAALLTHAAALGIAVPRQIELTTREKLEALAVNFPYPVVIKPSRSIGESNGRREKVGVRYAADATELREEVNRFSDLAFPLLLQQRVVGPGVGVFLLVWDGRIMARFAHRRLREKPPSGGVSVYRESIAADPALVDMSAALLARFAWQGPAMIEYKVESTSGTPYLMEINGRLWGSLQLAIDAGVDFPLLLARLATGEDVKPVTNYRIGVRSRWWWGDVDHLIARLSRQSAGLSLPSDAPSRLSAVLQFLRLWQPGDRNEILRLNDPWPAVRESIAWFSDR